MFQSPSLRGSGRFDRGRRRHAPDPHGFNPPSLRGSGRFISSHISAAPPRRVSIPFIAGQWSLPRAQARARAEIEAVSIPFIAGQWSLLVPPKNEPNRVPVVSIPFIAGQWSLRPGNVGASAPRPRVSIPFIAGQWSLRAGRAGRPPADGGWSQSPSLRGSGRFGMVTCAHAPDAGRVSIPFIAGQWSLRGDGPVMICRRAGLNPLHCGAVVASSLLS